MTLTPSPQVQCPRGGSLVLVWLVATLVAAVPSAIALAIAIAGGAGVLAFTAAMILACSPVASAVALALCRRAERAGSLTRDNVLGLFWITGSGFAVVVPLVVGAAMAITLVGGVRGPVQPLAAAGPVGLFLLIWLAMAVLGLVIGTPLSTLAGYLAGRLMRPAPQAVPGPSPIAGRPVAIAAASSEW